MAHSLKDMGSRHKPGHRLKPGGQNRNRIKDGTDGLQQKGHSPCQGFRLIAIAQYQGRGAKPQPPAHYQQVAGVPLRMEYSYFCQAWLPHLSPEDGERLLKMFGLAAEYDEFKPVETETRKCGCCGSDIQALPGAHQVVCENCGFTIDVNSHPIPCSKCGALLSFPVSADHVACPYCSTDNRRV